MQTLSRFGTCPAAGPGDPLTAWRRHALERAGFDPATAAGLAGCRGLDLHAVLTLVDHGCPPFLAARIMAPAGPADE